MRDWTCEARVRLWLTSWAAIGEVHSAVSLDSPRLVAVLAWEYGRSVECALASVRHHEERDLIEADRAARRGAVVSGVSP